VKEFVVEHAFSSQLLAFRTFAPPGTANHATFSVSARTFAEASHGVDLHASSLAPFDLQLNVKVAEFSLAPVNPRSALFAIFAHSMAKVQVASSAYLEHRVIRACEFEGKLAAIAVLSRRHNVGVEDGN
jgi:hypothetical protein